MRQLFFRESLADERAGARCRDYLRRRRLDDATVSSLGLGLAPEGWEQLRAHLLGKRFTEQELLAGGLVMPRKSGSGQYDRFRGRLMFPIRDVNGRTVAFGGRTLADAEPKYINSPETPIYKKGEHLYALDLAKGSIRRQGFAILVEGYLDVAAVLQAGFENVVASLGTAFTASQARLLSRYCRRIAFSYDGDAAGAAATERSLDLLLAHGFEVRVVELPGGTDPDDFIREHGAEAYGNLVREAPEYVEFLIRRESRRDLRRVEEKVAAVNAVLPHVARIGDTIARAEWAGRLADALRLDDRLVMQELQAAVRAARPQIRQRAPGSTAPRQVEARLVTQLLRSAAERERWSVELDMADLDCADASPVVQAILDLTRAGRRVDYPAVLDALTNDSDREWLTQVAFRDEPEEGPTVEDCLWTLRRARLAREARRLRRRIGSGREEAVSAGDVDEQLMRVQEIARQRDALS